MNPFDDLDDLEPDDLAGIGWPGAFVLTCVVLVVLGVCWYLHLPIEGLTTQEPP